MKTQLTVLIPCKNEISNLEACVASVRGLADEILIADSGSTDGTLAWIAAQPDCRLIEREFVNSGDFKNWAIPQANHPWVFILDADERVTPELTREIRAVIDDSPRYDGYRVNRLNHFMGHRVRHTEWRHDSVIRLVHRDRARYNVHTDHAEIDLPAGQCSKLRGGLIHFTCWDYDQYLSKMLRYTEQQAELWYRQGRRPSRIKLIANGPLRFLRCYVLELGFLDGRVGFQISMLTGFYSFLKQARLWQKHCGLAQPEIDVAPARLGGRPAVPPSGARRPWTASKPTRPLSV